MNELYQKHINGNKTNLVVLAVVLLGILHGAGLVVIPSSVWAVLGGAGMACIRDAVKKLEVSTKKDIAEGVDE